MIRLLVAEDEPQVRRALSLSLRAHGYEIDAVASGEEALLQAVVETPDGVILDVGLPDIRAAELVRLLRAWTVGPIILTASPDQEPDKVSALGAGADDYVTKPFGIAELLGRLRAALPGQGPIPEGRAAWVETSDFVLDLAHRRAYAGGEEVPLTGTEWQIVEVLVGRRGGLVLERDLLDEVWVGRPEPASGSLRRLMAQIKGKLEPDPARPRYFVCEPGLGYRFVAS
jgi:two-component system KDP operon response regulator KdpE